ncbi:MAG: arylsulfatase A-like enzyme [Planctomycetota bacterium]|jgi:arylsulfatase A-like enzyme
MIASFTKQRILTLFGIVGLALAAATGCSQAASGDVPPNLLIVTLDTTRADFLSCYNQTKGSTPYLDLLATEGVRFAYANSASAVTPVSHATILTGRYPHTHGLRVISAEGAARLKNSEWFIADTLKQSGYSTAAVHSAFPVSGAFGFDRSFDEFHSFDGDMELGKREGGTVWDQETLQRRSDDTTNLAIEVSDRLAEPFFMWLHYWDPHDDKLEPPNAFMIQRHVPKNKKMRGADQLYATELSFLDREFGRFLTHLRATERYENTIIVVTADHGEGLTDGMKLHGWGGHRTLNREQLHVPLIMRFPSKVEARTNVVVKELVRTADIVPTLLDYLQLPAPVVLDGGSLRGLIEGKEEEPRIAFSDQINGYDRNAHMVGKRPQSAFLYAVNDGNWKLIYRPHAPELSELYRVRTDRKEQENLYGKRADMEIEMLTLLAREAMWVTAPFLADGGEQIDASDALGALGYSESVLSDAAWAWTCPVHRSLYFENQDRCTECDELPIPIPAR